jgi:hypothetical protein
MSAGAENRNGPHFLLRPPSHFRLTHAAGGVMIDHEPDFYLHGSSVYLGKYSAPDSVRIDWVQLRRPTGNVIVVQGAGVGTESAQTVNETLRTFVEEKCETVPLAYLLVSARVMSPGQVLYLLACSKVAPPCAFSRAALDFMLASWVVNQFAPNVPLMAGRHLDIIGGGHDFYIDSDPVTEDIATQIVTARPSLAVTRQQLAKTLFPGELSAAVLARMVDPDDLLKFTAYSRGTLRQVFAGVLAGMQPVGGQVPIDRVRVGFHTDDDWAP